MSKDSIQDRLLIDSIISPTGTSDPPTSEQKWWAAIVIGFIFAIISSPLAYYATSKLTTTLGGLPLTDGPGPTLVGLLVHTIIFVLIIRLIMW